MPIKKLNKKTLKQVGLVFALMTAALTIGKTTAFAASVSGTDLFAQIFDLPSASEYGSVADPGGGDAQTQFNRVVSGIIQAVRYIIGSVAILMVVYSGFRMVTGWGKEEVYQKARASLLWSVIGLAAVGLAGEIPQILNLGNNKGGFLADPNQILRSAVLFDQRTQIIITFIKYFIGGVAVLMIIRSGLRLITMGASEEKIALDKKNLVYSSIGLVMIIIADTAISEVFYKVDLTRYPGTGGAEPAIDPVRGVQEIIGFTNFIVSIIGPVAVLALLAGGVMYITAGGEDEKMARAKRLIVTALVGIIIIYGAFAIVSTFVAGRFETPTISELV